jgi:hypothetical protein
VALSARLETLFRKMLGETDGTELHTVLESEVAVLSGGPSGAAQVLSVAPQTSVGVGAKAGTGVTVAEYGVGSLHTTVFTLTNYAMAMTDATTAGSHGTQKLYTFPQGPIQILGSRFNLTTARVGTAIDAAAELVGSLGTAAVGTNNATLSSTEADLIASYAGTLSSGAGVLKKHGSLVATAFDGTATPAEAHLNVAVPDAGSTGNDVLTINGTVTITWANLGDY